MKTFATVILLATMLTNPGSAQSPKSNKVRDIVLLHQEILQSLEKELLELKANAQKSDKIRAVLLLHKENLESLEQAIKASALKSDLSIAMLASLQKEVDELKASVNGHVGKAKLKTDNAEAQGVSKISHSKPKTLSGTWTTTVYSYQGNVIREVRFSQNGKVSSLDYLPGKRAFAGSPLVGSYRYESGVLDLHFAGAGQFNERLAISWLGNNSIESRNLHDAVVRWARHQ